jgi:hypothetical protein
MIRSVLMSAYTYKQLANIELAITERQGKSGHSIWADDISRRC